jgi:hypothetical protein
VTKSSRFIIYLASSQSIEEAAEFLFPVNTLVDLTRATLYSFLNPFNTRVDEFHQLIIHIRCRRYVFNISYIRQLSSYELFNYLSSSHLSQS